MQYIVISDNLSEIMLLRLAMVTKTTQNPLYLMCLLFIKINRQSTFTEKKIYMYIIIKQNNIKHHDVNNCPLRS